MTVDGSQWLVWQLADSAFPTGGFVHSGGLEAALQLGAVRAIGVEAWLTQALTAVAAQALPFVAAAHAGDEVVALDSLLDASLTNHVANRASRAQGQALVATAANVFAGAALTALKARLRGAAAPGHLAPWSGAVLAALGVDAPTARRLVLFQHLRGLVSAAVRLGAIGPLAAQALQARLAAHGEALASRAPAAVDDAATTAPFAELVHAQHDRLYSRLFNT